MPRSSEQLDRLLGAEHGIALVTGEVVAQRGKARGSVQRSARARSACASGLGEVSQVGEEHAIFAHVQTAARRMLVERRRSSSRLLADRTGRASRT